VLPVVAVTPEPPPPPPEVDSVVNPAPDILVGFPEDPLTLLAPPPAEPPPPIVTVYVVLLVRVWLVNEV
jgi:hypothetical protein